MATSFTAVAQPKPPSLLIRRCYSLLPKARHALDIYESDSVPDAFLTPSDAAVNANALATALNNGRAAIRISWRFGPPPLTGDGALWEAWISSLLKEARQHSPQNVADSIMPWLTKAFVLEASTDDLWEVPLELRAFDQSLAAVLEGRMSGDAEFARQLRQLDRAAMQVGKSVPARKLLSMLGFRAIRDPTYEDSLYESAFI